MDECKNCTLRGNLDDCLSSFCNHHESWMALELKSKLDAKDKELGELKEIFRRGEIKELIRPGHKVDGDWILVPVEDLTTPIDGRICRAKRWWAVTEANEVLFYQTYHSPQCNVNEAIVKSLVVRNDFESVKFIEMAFVPVSMVE
jgi:hypothetical protein